MEAVAVAVAVEEVLVAMSTATVIVTVEMEVEVEVEEMRKVVKLTFSSRVIMEEDVDGDINGNVVLSLSTFLLFLSWIDYFFCCGFCFKLHNCT